MHAIGRQEELVVDRAQTGHRVTVVRQAEPFCVAAGLVGRGAAAPHAPRVADVCAEAVVVGRAAMMWQQARRASSRGRVAATAAAAGTLACAPAWWTSSRRPAVLRCVCSQAAERAARCWVRAQPRRRWFCWCKEGLLVV